MVKKKINTYALADHSGRAIVFVLGNGLVTG
jgi:hypothetical protein